MILRKVPYIRDSYVLIFLILCLNSWCDILQNNKQYYTLGVAKQNTKAAPAPVNAHVKIVPRSA